MGAWRTRRGGLALIVAVLAAGSAARAQGKPPRCETNAAYGALAEQASQLSRSGQIEAALATYQAAYRQCADPRLLFNTARLLHRLGRPAQAVEYYERFLASKDETDPERLIQIREYLLQARREAGLVPPPAPSPVQQAIPAAAPTAQTSEAASSPPSLTATRNEAPRTTTASRFPAPAIALLAGGGALLVTGLGLGAATQQASRELVNGDGPFDSALYSRAQAMDRAGITLDVLGGAALTAGIVWSITWASQRSRARTPAPTGTSP